MNNKKILNYEFSIFGDIKNFHDNISSYLDIFKDFEKEILKDVLQNGIEYPCYKFKNDEVSILLHFDRIDFEFKSITNGDCEKVNKYLNLFINQINKVNRLAINFNYLYEDKEFKLLNEIASKSFFPNKENLKELFLRKNNVFKESDVEFNDVVTILNGTFQNNETFELIESVIFQFDINTIVGQAIEKDRINDIFKVIMLSLRNEIQEINHSIEGVEL